MQSAFFPQQSNSQQQEQYQHTRLPGTGLSPKSSKSASVTHTCSPQRGANGSISQGCVVSRALRFPSSRRYLWDRTAAGAQVLVDVSDYLPQVQVAVSTFGAISRAAKGAASSLTLQLNLSVTASNQVTALVQEHDPLGGQAGLQLPCSLGQQAEAAADIADSLRAAVQVQLDQRDIARVHQLYALSASAVAAPSPADPISLKLQLLMPRVGLLLTPLYTKRLCHVPLAETLLKPGCMQPGQTGYLSMDQARSLLPLEATDANVYSTPLVGVWVKGPSSVLHPLVATACLRFAYSSLLMDRAVNPADGAFLLLLCPEGDPVSKCFEVRLTDSSVLELCSYKLTAGIRLSAGVTQYPGGLVPADWVPEQHLINPLAGHLAAAAAATAGPTRRIAAGGGNGTAAGRSWRGEAGSAGGLLCLPQPDAAGADGSPMTIGHGHFSRAGVLPMERSSAPTATFTHQAMRHAQHAAAAQAAARHSLPLPCSSQHSSYGVAVGAAGLWPSAAAGARADAGAFSSLAGTGSSAAMPCEEPQPRARIPVVPYGSTASVSECRPPWQQQQQQQQQMLLAGGDQPWAQPGQQVSPIHGRAGGAASEAAAHGSAVAQASNQGEGPSAGSSPSPSHRGSRRLQLSWSERQQQVLRTSLDGAAEALRSSQASLAAAKEAAQGNSRHSSPSKPRSCPQGEAHGSEPHSGLSTPTSHLQPAALTVAPSSPQPGLSRLGSHMQQQREEHADTDADSDCGPRLGSPVRQAVQKKTSMLAVAASHAAGLSPPAAGTAWTGGPGSRPVSPAVQAGVALTNLALLQQLSSGQLQQALYHMPSPGSSSLQQLQQPDLSPGAHSGHLDLGSAACSGAAATAAVVGQGSWLEQHGAADCYAAAAVSQQQAQRPSAGNCSQPAAAAAGLESPATAGYLAAPFAADAAAASLRDSLEASSAAALAIRAANTAMQCISPSPYGRSLGVQRYAVEAAAMQSCSQEFCGATSLWSPGMPDSCDGCNSSSSSRYRQQQLMQQQQQMRLLPRTPGATAGLHWQQQQLQVSPVSPSVSGTWLPDPVAQALQGEVDKLRHELQQLQRQLRLAGMSVPAGPESTAASKAEVHQQQQQLPLPLPRPQQQETPAQPPPPQQGMHLQQQEQVSPAATGQWCNTGQGTRVGNATSGAAAARSAAHVAAGVVQPGVEQLLQPATDQRHQPQQQQLQRQQHQQAAGVQQHSQPAVAPAAAGGHQPAGVSCGAELAKSSKTVQPTKGSRSSPSRKSPSSPAAAEAALVQPVSAGTGCAAAGQQPHARQQAGPAVATACHDQSAAALQSRRRKLEFDASSSVSSSVDSGCVCGTDGVMASGNNNAAASSDLKVVMHFESNTAAAPVVKTSHLAAAGAGADAAAGTAPTCGGAEGSPVGCSSPGCLTQSKHTQRGDHRGAACSAAGSSSSTGAGAGLQHSLPRSGGRSGVRASLEAPPLVELVRTRVVDLSEDSDEDDWEDRLLVKYGLK